MNRRAADDGPSLFDKPVSLAEPDITARKHQGNAQSVAAWDKAQVSADERKGQICRWLAQRGDVGGTCDEFAAEIGVEVNTVSGRFSDLKRRFFIKQKLDAATGKPLTRATRTGSSAAVYVLNGPVPTQYRRDST